MSERAFICSKLIMASISCFPKEFYPALEGVRGIAVALVVLYHFMPDICPSGYLGVDVFIVMSGFFLAKGVMNQNGCADFNFGVFCRKKLLRLFPPLVFMMLCIIPLSLFLLPYRTLEPSISTGCAALLGYANVYLDSTANSYFGPGAKENLFTHVWYLSVTVQVYVFFACFLCLTKRFSTKWRWGLLFFLGGISLLYANSRIAYHYFFPFEPLYTLYYSTPARLFEFVLGSAGALFVSQPRKHISPIFGYVALLLICLCSFSVSGLGRPVVLLCSAVMVVLFVVGTDNKLLSCRSLRFLGKYSFSVYLWHWPLFVIWNYYDEGAPWYIALAAMTAAVLCGIAAYYIAEKPKWSILLLLVSWSSVFGGLKLLEKYPETASVFRKDAFVSDLPDGKPKMVYCKDYPSREISPWKEAGVRIGAKKNIELLGDEKATPSFVVMGDSHAGAFKCGLHDVMLSHQRCGYYVPAYVTPFDNRMTSRKQFRFSGNAADACLKWLERHPEIRSVILIQRWSIRLKNHLDDEGLPMYYDESLVVEDSNLYDETVIALERFCLKLQEAGKNVVVMTEVPPIAEEHPYGYVSRAAATGKPINYDRLECSEKAYSERCGRQYGTLKELENKGFCKLICVEQAAFEQGVWKAVQGNKVYMKDDDHVSPLGAVYLARKQKSLWLKVLDAE